LHANATLNSIVKLCVAKRNRRFGVRSVITYNYDNLLEMALSRKRPYKAVYSKDGDYGDHLPVFHVHGYVPHDRGEIDRKNDAIIFTEEQYNSVASDPYSWSNIVQLREMSSSTGLMIGLSLSDRNIRRLLDALNQPPIRPKIFALLKVPNQKTASNEEMDSIHERAIDVFDKFEQSGIKGVGIKSPRGSGGSASRHKTISAGAICGGRWSFFLSRIEKRVQRATPLSPSTDQCSDHPGMTPFSFSINRLTAIRFRKFGSLLHRHSQHI
jgi:hypothetical protein